MAARSLVLIVACLCFVSGQQVTPSDNYVVEVDPTSCSKAEVDGAFQFFDSVTMACKKCSQNSTVQRTSADGLSCECKSKHRYTRRFGGDQVTCEACGPNENVTTDGWECKVCADGSTDCTCDAANTITVERGLDGEWVNPGPPQKDQCVSCEGNTAPNAQGDRCIRCTDDLKLGFSSCQTCPKDQQADGFCFLDPDDLLPSAPLLFEIPRIDGGGSNTPSKYFETHLRAAYAMCTKYQNITACQVVANLCALTLYNERQGRICNTIVNTVPAGTLFQILYYNDDPEDVVGANDILDTYTLSPPTTIPLEAAVHTLEGRYLGNQPLTDGLLQLCDTTETIANAAYLFGTYYKYTCTIKAKGLWNTVKHPLLFYDIYLKYKDSDQQRLFKVPLVIEDIRDQSDDLVNTGSINDWRITRRMFLVDNQMEIPSTGSSADDSGIPSAEEALYVRYAKDITLHISLQADTADGRIEVPHITVKYGEVSLEKANNEESVQISFTTTYTMSWSFFRRNFQIAVGTLGCMATLYAGFRSWVWSKRAGRPSIDFPTLVNLVFYMAASLSYMFFVITFCLAFYWFIFFKRQDVVYLVHPDGKLVEEWAGLFYGAFALRCLSLVHLVVMQCSADVFLVDWERPRGVKTGQDGKKTASAVPVSIWRTYFVANEWNEIQAVRKSNSNLQVLAVVFFLKVVGLEQTTSMDPEGQVDRGGDSYTAQQSTIYRYALAALVYILVAVVQWVFFTFIYERFVEDKVQQFVDLCSMSNVSVFIMAHAHFGYYIHGRSVHGKADADLQEMASMMKREEEDLCGKRGLLPDTEEQTFIMSLPKRLRVKYEQVYLPAALENAGAMAQGGATSGRLTGGTKEKSVEAYNMLNKFLCAFIDHSLRDLDYVVKDKTLLETLMDTEFFDTTDKGILYKDNGHSFDQVLFYGHEMSLLLFDVLLFCVVDRIGQNYLLAGVIVFLVSNLVRMIRDTAGKKNLVRKTLVDERFLI